jgi:hemerythrin
MASELTITKTNFIQRIDEIEIEIRRIVNILQQDRLLSKLDETGIKTVISDFLFDHNYLNIIMTTSGYEPLMKINSPSYPSHYSDFMALSAGDIVAKLDISHKNKNQILIDLSLNILYLIKDITSQTGLHENTVVFIFSPELMLKYLPENYAFLINSGNTVWVPASNNFPSDFKIPEYTENSLPVQTLGSKTIFFTKLYGKNSSYYLAASVNTAELKTNLMLSTAFTASVFTIFFVMIFMLVYLRNIQINQLIQTQKATVVCLANLAEFKDNETADHLERTRHYGTLLSNHLKQNDKFKYQIGKEYIENIGFASVLHDIGKVGVPDSILKKPGRLTPEEFEIIKKHPAIASEILKDLVEKHKINDIFFTLSYNIAAYHHEKWDGSGYPHGISGTEIPLEARIFALCDVYDALRSERVYKDPFSHEKAVAIINSGNGTHFDPDIVDAFNECAEEFNHIHETYLFFYTEVDYSDFGNNKRELKVEWNPRLSVGIDIIDDQHKVLLDKINELIRAILEGGGRGHISKVLDFLNSYIDEHFNLEERIMRENNSPGYEHHKNEHDRFKAEFDGMYRSIKEKGISPTTLADLEKKLITWLLRHISELDTKIVIKDKNKAVSG